jgi:hypothetical protein
VTQSSFSGDFTTLRISAASEEILTSLLEANKRSDIRVAGESEVLQSLRRILEEKIVTRRRTKRNSKKK